MTAQRAAIYARISKDSEALGEGVDRQVKACRDLAERRGYEVLESHVYIENDVSASTNSKKPRPKYQTMLEAVEAGQFDIILAYSLSRLTRRVREFLDLTDLHREKGVIIRTCVSGDPDLSTADGRGTAITLATWDQAEAERTSERIAAFAQHRAEQGLPGGGRRPFGYRYATDEHGEVLTGRDRQLVIDPWEAGVLREAGQRVLDGEALWSIVKDLTGRGVRTTTGGAWQTQTLRRALLRWTNAGLRAHRPTRGGRPAGPLQLHEGTWEPIVDRGTHERIVATLTDPSRVSNKGDTALRYLLTWIARCGACGEPLVGTKEYTYTVKGSYVRKDGTRSPDRERTYPAQYRCPHAGCHGVTRRMDVVDEYVGEHVIGVLEAEGVRVLGGDAEAAQTARGEIEDLQARMLLLSDMLMEDAFTREQFERQNARLRDQLEGAKARLRAAQGAEELGDMVGLSAREAWEQADVHRRRRLLTVLDEIAGLTIRVDPVGTGRLGKRDADPFEGISLSWSPASL